LPNASVYDLAVHPADSRLVYAATEFGVFASDNGGQSWWPTNEGPANVAVNEPFWIGDLLGAATAGRGLFWIDLSSAPQGFAANASAPTPGAPAIGPARERGTPAIVIEQVPVRPIDPTNPR